MTTTSAPDTDRAADVAAELFTPDGGQTFCLLGEHLDAALTAAAVTLAIQQMHDAGEMPSIDRQVDTDEAACGLVHDWAIPFGGSSYLTTVPHTGGPVTADTPDAVPLTRIVL